MYLFCCSQTVITFLHIASFQLNIVISVTILHFDFDLIIFFHHVDCIARFITRVATLWNLINLNRIFYLLAFFSTKVKLFDNGIHLSRAQWV